ncbi:MAG: ribosome silencing factor [bacterium]|nr:ribosome silencing factor [bacterium]
MSKTEETAADRKATAGRIDYMTKKREALVSDLTSEAAVKLAAEVVLGQKGLDVCPINVKHLTDITEGILIASGTSQKHVQGMADKVMMELKPHGEEAISVSGYESGDWILLDYGNFIVHLFHIPIRDFYNLEELWKNGTFLKLPEELEQILKRQRTRSNPFGGGSAE